MHRPGSRSVLCSLTLAALLGLAAPHAAAQAAASSSTFATRLSGESEVPPVASNASGRVDANLNPQTRVLTWTISFSGLSGPATAAHFHGPAMPGENTGVALPIAGPLASPITGAATLTAAQASDFMAGKWYVNLHTAANPGGEIRGQVTVQR